MDAFPKVVGLIQAKDDWPLLAFSVSHALLNHVDEVLLLNHGGNDAMSGGLAKLAGLWPGRLAVLDLDDPAFFQEAASSVLLEACQSSSPDWIYAFDADEFLLTRDRRPLKAVLRAVDPAHSAIRYQVQNWVSFQDFDDAAPEAYARLRFRSEPNLLCNAPPKALIAEIRSGARNYYDVPFGSKVILRNRKDVWLSAGAHDLKSVEQLSVLETDCNDVRAAHFPLLSRDRLRLRAQQGERLAKDGFGISHGWQSHLIYDLWKEGELDGFWRRHALSINAADLGDGAQPKVVEDEAFVRSIEPTLSLVKNEFGAAMIRDGQISSPPVARRDSRIELRTAIRSVRRIQSVAEEKIASHERMSKQLAKARNRPISVFWNLIYFRLLVFATRLRFLLSDRVRMRIAQSAQKRDPNRSLAATNSPPG